MMPFMLQELEPAIMLLPLAWLSVTDLRRRIIPNASVIAIVLVHVAMALGGMLLGGSSPLTVGLTLVSSLLQAFVVGVTLVVSAIAMDRALGQESIGGGDIKLISAIAFCVGWERCLVVVFLGSLLGVALWLALRGRARKTGHPANTFAWGPCLSVAFLVVMLAGGRLTPWA